MQRLATKKLFVYFRFLEVKTNSNLNISFLKNILLRCQEKQETTKFVVITLGNFFLSPLNHFYQPAKTVAAKRSIQEKNFGDKKMYDNGHCQSLS